MQALSLAGSCRNGAERDSGFRAHAVPEGTYKALCGARPGRHSAGWSTYPHETITCPRCLARLAKQQPTLEELAL